MDKLSSFLRMSLTWIVIIPNLIVSYLYLKNPSFSLEMYSLGLNFVCATVLFYIYLDIYKTNENNENVNEEEDTRTKDKKESEPKSPLLYRLVFGSLIEDMLVWLGLFFIFYNIVPVTLYVHNWIGKNL